jgi:hypothetical protein
MSVSFSNYCIVELFGHQKIVGMVTEQVIAGQGYVRVDVPKTQRQPAFTRMFGTGAIYSITPVDETIAMQAAENLFVEPVTVYIDPTPKLEHHNETIENDYPFDNGDDDDN